MRTLLIGALFLFSAMASLISFAFRPRDMRDNPIAITAVLAATGFGVGAAGVWFGILRGRVITERCWLCTNGVVWMTEQTFDWFAWADVPEVYCNTHGARPAIGIRFNRNISWISFSNTHAAQRLVQYIENRASAARLPTVLRPFAEGKTIPFANRGLQRHWIESLRERFDWTQIAAVEVDDRDLVLLGHGDRQLLTIPMEEIPFPSMFTALVRAIIAHARERPGG